MDSFRKTFPRAKAGRLGANSLPMVDTLDVRRAGRIGVVAATLGTIIASVCPCKPQAVPGWAPATAFVAQKFPQARIVVLDVATGRLLTASHLADAAHTLAAPGSTLKPLALYGLISAGRWDPGHRIACTRNLHIAGRSLACSHPASDPMDARQALAWSCNTYFAAVGASLAPRELRRLLEPTGLLGQTGLVLGQTSPAGNEAVAEFREPAGKDAASLALLGVDGIKVTPLELAEAYRWLALQLASHPGSAAAEVVQAGLNDSASFGIAAQASEGGVAVAGKTGTANFGAGTPSHGWFVGLAPAAQPKVVVVVYLQAGHGANAAAVAAALLAHSPLRQGKP